MDKQEYADLQLRKQQERDRLAAASVATSPSENLNETLPPTVVGRWQPGNLNDIDVLKARIAELEGRLAPSQPVTVDDQPAEPGMMKTATIVLGLHKDHTLAKANITPAEMQLLITMHMPQYKDDPIRGFTETPPVSRTATQEVSRLRAIYGRDRVKALFGPNTSLPATFADAHASGKEWAMENPPAESAPLVGRRPSAAEQAADL
jgi:hypothetical protein